jgi:hypothetical protein
MLIAIRECLLKRSTFTNRYDCACCRQDLFGQWRRLGEYISAECLIATDVRWAVGYSAK